MLFSATSGGRVFLVSFSPSFIVVDIAVMVWNLFRAFLSVSVSR
jgi:hypothetical protein